MPAPGIEMPTSQTACACHSLDKTCQQDGSVALRSLVAHSSFSDEVPNHLGLHSPPELEDHSWQDMAVLLSFFCFFSGHQSSGDPLISSAVTGPCFWFFFSFFRRGGVLGLEGREECLTKEGVFCFVEHDLLSH